MGQARQISQAMVIGSREDTRQIASTLIEESGFHVIEADTLDEASELLMRFARRITFVFAEASDADQARMFARLVESNWPWIRVLVSFDPNSMTATDLPANAAQLRRPWRPLDLLIETERVMH